MMIYFCMMLVFFYKGQPESTKILLMVGVLANH
jgi:hypothetical protein